ncbi:twin-arginine translocase TatA/TatE family subunit [bacterium]|nr:MAG: twin-arginine translocase TatA/TatE family subunit [bacterium]
MLGPFGPTELIIVLVIVVILFGASRLPEIGKGIGEAIKNFKKSMSEQKEIDVTPKKDSGSEKESSSESNSEKGT